MRAIEKEVLWDFMKPSLERQIGKKNPISVYAARHVTRGADGVGSDEPVDLKALVVVPSNLAEALGRAGAGRIQTPAIGTDDISVLVNQSGERVA